MPRKLRLLLLSLAFLEGGAVMVSELAGAKLLAPVFGTSLYAWAAVLGITLGALASGYFAGGLASKKSGNPLRLLYIILTLAGVLVALMPGISSFIFRFTVDFEIRLGAILSLLIYMFPPLLLFGMTSPLIISIISAGQDENAGSSAGKVYAISTVGGIVFTFAAGFYFLPEQGISFTTLTAGLLLALPPFILLLIRNKESAVAILLIAFGMAFLFRPQGIAAPGYFTLYESDGILGQVKVTDHVNSPGNTTRMLLVNNSGQTMVNLENPEHDFWSYTSFMPHILREIPTEKTLLIGLGGGTIVKKLSRHTNDITIVELDKRIHEVAVRYFGMSPSQQVIIDDGRRYISKTSEQFDAIIFDAFQSETPPVHLYTIEALQDVLEKLRPGGHLLINFYGFRQGENARVVWSLYHTLAEVSDQLTVFKTREGNNEMDNLLFVIGPAGKKIAGDPGHSLNSYVVQPPGDLSEFPVFTDDLPVMEKLYIGPAMAWRKSWIDYYLGPAMRSSQRNG